MLLQRVTKKKGARNIPFVIDSGSICTFVRVGSGTKRIVVE
jgi:hypothetical protein